jgi:hypothetical protein
MHAAKLENSARLRNVLRVLECNKKPQSTMQLIQKSGHCAINSIVSDLRENGIDVKCKRDGDAWYYWIGE